MESNLKNISEVTEPLREEILNGHVHTIDEMRAWLRPLGYSDAINEAAINLSCVSMHGMTLFSSNFS